MKLAASYFNGEYFCQLKCRGCGAASPGSHTAGEARKAFMDALNGIRAQAAETGVDAAWITARDVEGDVLTLSNGVVLDAVKHHGKGLSFCSDCVLRPTCEGEMPFATCVRGEVAPQRFYVYKKREVSE
jgi:hypothetical protein